MERIPLARCLHCDYPNHRPRSSSILEGRAGMHAAIHKPRPVCVGCVVHAHIGAPTAALDLPKYGDKLGDHEGLKLHSCSSATWQRDCSPCLQHLLDVCGLILY
jgi:hypothetical protein